MFSPKLFYSLKNCNWQNFSKDLMADRIISIIALPLPFAITSGLSPKKGLITAIVARFLISA